MQTTCFDFDVCFKNNIYDNTNTINTKSIPESFPILKDDTEKHAFSETFECAFDKEGFESFKSQTEKKKKKNKRKFQNNHPPLCIIM